MKTRNKMLIPLPLLLAGLGLIPAVRTTAQTFTTLYRFTDGNDGASPYCALLLSGNTLYGTAQDGGSGNAGTLFAVNTNGTGFTTVHDFTAMNASIPTNSGGGTPSGSLTLSDNTFYGVAQNGGPTGRGTVFAVNLDGAGFRTLHNFSVANLNNADGGTPIPGLILSGNTLYGVAQYGGLAGDGTVFAVNTNGTGFKTLHSFGVGNSGADGAFPIAGLILWGGTLYGTTSAGGGPGNGTVFAINTNGTGFKTLHAFTATDPVTSANSDGASPGAGALILSGNTLYGTASHGGGSGSGTVFALNTNGSNFTTLHSFAALNFFITPNSFIQTNGDGAYPNAGLILSGATLYGTVENGGAHGTGTVFAVNTNGTVFTVLHSFTAVNPISGTNTDGANPAAALILSGDTLYGTTTAGGRPAPRTSSSFGSPCSGTVFAISLPSTSGPQLAITPSGTNVVLTWTNTATGFTLESTTNPAPPAVWTTVSSAPVAINGQFTVTNANSDSAMFYRLSR